MSSVGLPAQAYCRNCGAPVTSATEICMSCGARPMVGKTHCHACGAETNPLSEICVKCGARLSAVTPAAGSASLSSKSRIAVTLLAFFIGFFGIHRLYAGKITTGITMLALGVVGWALYIIGIVVAVTADETLGGILIVVGVLPLAAVSIWAFVDFIIAVVGKMKDKEGKLIQNW